jgi:hypothetical protein
MGPHTKGPGCKNRSGEYRHEGACHAPTKQKGECPLSPKAVIRSLNQLRLRTGSFCVFITLLREYAKDRFIGTPYPIGARS